MRNWRVLALVAQREITETVRTRTFRIVTALLMIGAIAAIVVPNQVGDSSPPTHTFALVGAAPAGLADALAAQGPLIGARIKTQTLPDEAAARAALTDKRVDIALLDSQRVLVRRADAQLSLVLNRALSTARLSERLASVGVPAAEAAELVEAKPLRSDEVEPLSSARRANRAVAMAGVLLIYIALLTYGGMIAQSIAEEKSCRVSEVLLGAMRPHQLLAGKIAGIGAVGVLQLLAIGVAAGGAQLSQGSLHAPRGTPLTFAAVLLWFVLGFGLYSCCYAAAGATASRPQEAAAASAPLTFLIVMSYGAAFAGVADPDGVGARVLSFIPFLAPMTMLPRAAVGHVAPWEIVVSAALVLACTYGLVRLAGRIYTGAILHTGPRVKLRDAWRSAASRA